MTLKDKPINPISALAYGDTVDFGRAAADYARHRAGFPESFFDLIASRGYAAPGQDALDLGTGTGTLARGLARLGLGVTGLDPSAPLLAEAAELDRKAGVTLTYRQGAAETTGLDAASFDLITAGQCWHWFDRPAAATECARLLRPGGRLLIAHFDWLPLLGSVVAATEALILAHNPDWPGAGGTGIYPQWLADMSGAGFTGLETASFDVAQPYAHENWRGRVRACAGVAATLPPEAVAAFDAALAEMLSRDFPAEPLFAPHRVWLATGCAG